MSRFRPEFLFAFIWLNPLIKAFSLNIFGNRPTLKSLFTIHSDYTISSKNTWFSCHVRADGNAPHAPELQDVDCLMCHSDIYRRKLLLDPNDTITVTTFEHEKITYFLGLKDATLDNDGGRCLKCS